MSDACSFVLFEKYLDQLKIQLNEKQKKQFIRYYELLMEWNRIMNLTAITEWENVVVCHFIDSLSIVKVHDIKRTESMIDVGTGAGFPGIPLKIVFPELSVVLLDSLNKRIRFLNQVMEDLHLVGITAVHARAEDAAGKECYRESFDLAVSRAVAKLNVLSEYALPFVKENGCFIAYKSGTIDGEADNARRAVKILGGDMKRPVRFRLADNDIERSFVIIKKVRTTPEKYPRKAGLPAKVPL